MVSQTKHSNGCSILKYSLYIIQRRIICSIQAGYIAEDHAHDVHEFLSFLVLSTVFPYY